MRLLGIILVILGVICLIYGGFTFFIPRGELWLGPLSVAVHENLEIPLPPVLGLLFLILGMVMILSSPVVVAPPPP